MDIQLTGRKFEISADSVRPAEGGSILTGARVTVDLPAAPVRYLYSGWQSWSLTAWIETNRPVHPLRPKIMYPRETDPLYTRETRPNGSWYGAVELPDKQIVFLGALALESHVMLENGMLTGWYEETGVQSLQTLDPTTGVVGLRPCSKDWFLAAGDETKIFTRYAELLGQRFGKGRQAAPPRVWCSWYSLYTEIDETRLSKILNDLGDMPFNIFQVDDGWQVGIGDWEPNAKFPSGMDGLAVKIKATGRTAGLWLAPLLAAPSSSLQREHPDWLLRDEKGRLVSAGYNWGEQISALDTTHPAVLDWLAALMQKVRGWGYDYVKLDFLYGGALPGKRHLDIPRETAYRNGLKVVREALGDAYFLACGSPILPSLGLCDGIRLGQDVAEHWNSPLFDDLLVNFGAPGGRNALRNMVNRLWLQPLVQADPDVVYFGSRLNKLTPEHKSLMQDMAEICNFKASSDIPAWLTDSEQAALHRFLESRPQVRQTGRYAYQIGDRAVDFEPFIQMPPRPGPVTNALGALLGGLANIPGMINFVDRLNQKLIKKKLDQNPS